MMNSKLLLTALGGLFALSLSSLPTAAEAASRAYDMKEVSCDNPANLVCLSWDLQTAPGGARGSSFSLTLEKGEQIAGVIKPKRSRVTGTQMSFNPALDIYVSEGMEPTESRFDCKVSATNNCRIYKRNAQPLYFMVKAREDAVNTSIAWTYTVSN